MNFYNSSKIHKQFKHKESKADCVIQYYSVGMYIYTKQYLLVTLYLINTNFISTIYILIIFTIGTCIAYITHHLKFY